MNARKQKISLIAIALIAASLPDLATGAMKLADYYKRIDKVKAECTEENYVIKEYSTVDVYPDNGSEKDAKQMPDFVCIRDRYRDSDSRTRTTTRFERDPNTDCNYANRFDGQNGRKCQTAENIVKGVAGRNRAVGEANTLIAGGLQVTNAMQVTNSQEAALKNQAFNMKVAIGSALLETTNHIYGATQLSQAESEAQSAARGIRGAQQAYDDAKAAAMKATGNKGTAEFKAALDDKNSIEQIRAAAEQKMAAARKAAARPLSDDAKARDLQTKARDFDSESTLRKQEGVIKGANALEASLRENGLTETANEFDSFEQMRASTRRGISESKNIEEQAANGAGQSRMLAVGSALQSAQAIAAYRQLMQQQNNLGSLPAMPPPAFALDNPGTPTPGASIPISPSAPVDPGLDFGDDPVGALPRVPMRGDIKMGGGIPGNQYKPHQAQVSSGTGSRGVSGGGGTPPNRNQQNRVALSPGNHDYNFGTGGGRLNQFGGSAHADAGMSDVQDAIKSLLGGEEQKNAAAQLEQYRELASVGEKGSESAADDARTLFERVNEKYSDLQNNGII